MNKLATILISVIILLAFSFCSATKDLSKENHPFKVIKATYNTWVGGQPGVKGINVVITIDNPEIHLDSIFFRDKKTLLKKDNSTESNIFIGVFTQRNTVHDYILHENSSKEYGNTPPKALLNIPIELKNNEALVSYLYKGNIHYCKIKEIKEVKSSVRY